VRISESGIAVGDDSGIEIDALGGALGVPGRRRNPTSGFRWHGAASGVIVISGAGLRTRRAP
jgi:hypothetical protein